MLEVAPGVLWGRLPIRESSSSVNVWAIADGEGWAVVDTGMPTEETLAAWSKIFAGGFAGRPVTRVLLTHWHPDHAGMAGWMTRKFSCRLWMTRTEYLTYQMKANWRGRELSPDGTSFYRGAGWDAQRIETYQARFGNFGVGMYAAPDSFERLRDGDGLPIGAREWRIVVGSGHSPEHACLYCPELRLLISGDQVLPAVAPHVMVDPTEPNADPVTDWMASLAKLKRELPDDVLVLPAHQQPFRGLHVRLDELALERQRLLQKLLLALDEPKRVIDLFGGKSYANPTQFGWATGSTIANLNHLIGRGAVARSADAAGILRYSLTQPAVHR